MRLTFGFLYHEEDDMMKTFTSKAQYKKIITALKWVLIALYIQSGVGILLMYFSCTAPDGYRLNPFLFKSWVAFSFLLFVITFILTTIKEYYAPFIAFLLIFTISCVINASPTLELGFYIPKTLCP